MTLHSENISNEEVKYYMDEVLKKISRYILTIANENEYGLLENESLYICRLFFERFKIQFYSAHKLANEFTNDTNHNSEYLDIVSIEAIQRTCYENYLLFNYLYIQKGQYMDIVDREDYLIELKFKLLLYKRDGYYQNELALSTYLEKKKEAIRFKKDIEKIIVNTSIYKNLNIERKKNLYKEWKPSWNEISKGTILSEWYSKNMYNILSQNSHSSYVSLIKMDHHYRNLEEYDRDSMNLQLYILVTLYLEDLYQLLKFPKELFSLKELSLMGEFKLIAQKNPNDIKEGKSLHYNV